MFTDGRSKRLVLLAHCLLNQNAISDGTAVYPAAFKDLVALLLGADISILQLPCPELCCLGLDRGNPDSSKEAVVRENTRIRKEMQTEDNNRKLQCLVDFVMQQVLEYHKYGFEIIGIIGANRSPNCGVETTSDNNAEVDGKGLFMSALSARLAEAGLTVPMTGLKSADNISRKITALLQ